MFLDMLAALKDSTQTFVNMIVVNLNPKGNFRQIKPWKCYFCGEGPNGSIESSLSRRRSRHQHYAVCTATST